MTKRGICLALAFGAIAAWPGTALAASTDEHHAGIARLGKVTFAVSCEPTARQEFEVAMAYYHSFAWPELDRTLDRVVAADPGCGMAHWARALGVLTNPFLWPGNMSPAVLRDAGASIDAARAAGLPTEREQDYVAALAILVGNADNVPYPTRAQGFEAAMAEVAAKYPDDREASILYALVLSANFDPNDKQYGKQLQAARILEPIFARQPDHPGVAHYLIHSYDYPPIAQQGLEAARRYSAIAPDAQHAQHMPSHIFTRVGYWRESVEANRQSARIDADRTYGSAHAYDYMVYALLQMGQDQAAREVLDHAMSVPDKADHLGAAYAYAAMPARIALERGAWEEAAKLVLNPAADAYPWKKYPQAEAINAYARGVGAALMGDADAARRESARLQLLSETAATMKIGYWAEQIAIQSAVVQGLATCADGTPDGCLAILAAAADREDATEKHVVTPGPVLPAREVLAMTLARFGRYDEALRAFEAVLDKEPNRYRALAGAVVTAESAGDLARQTRYAERVIEQTASADSPRPEMEMARRTLGR